MIPAFLAPPIPRPTNASLSKGAARRNRRGLPRFRPNAAYAYLEARGWRGRAKGADVGDGLPEVGEAFAETRCDLICGPVYPTQPRVGDRGDAAGRGRLAVAWAGDGRLWRAVWRAGSATDSARVQNCVSRAAQCLRAGDPAADIALVKRLLCLRVLPMPSDGATASCSWAALRLWPKKVPLGGCSDHRQLAGSFDAGSQREICAVWPLVFGHWTTRTQMTKAGDYWLARLSLAAIALWVLLAWCCALAFA